MAGYRYECTQRLLNGVAACLFAALAALPSAGEEHWRFAIEETPGSVQDAYANKFKELIEAKSSGAVRVTVYPYGSLGTSDQVTELLNMGIVQFAMASPGHLGTIIPEVQVLLLHFVFSDDMTVNRRALRDPELLRQFDALYTEKSFKLLSIYSEGWMVWTTNREVRMPADFRGMKIRVMTSPLLLAAYKAYAASPTPLPYGEVYSALQLHMVDAQVNPVFAIQEMSFYEVSDWMISARHAPFVTTAVTNADFFEALPAAQRAMVVETIDELDEYIFGVQEQFNAERLNIIRKRKPDLRIVESLSEEERAAFRDASLVVREQFVQMVGPSGKTILDALLGAVRRAEDAAPPSSAP